MRWDGTHKLTDAVASLADRFELVPVCPEDEVGMGTPREPIKLDRRRRLVGVRSRLDHTDRMRAFAARRLDELGPLDGWIFKARSPSCGLWTVPVEGEGAVGRGTFSEVVTASSPGMPVAEEQEIDETFVERVVAHWRHRTGRGSPRR